MKWKGFRDVQATIEIDLKGKSEKELWNSIDKDAKWGVKKAEKSRLKIEIKEDEKSWGKFYEIYKETCKYGKIVPIPIEECKEGKLFACFLEDKLIAGAVIKVKKNKIILFLNASIHKFLKYQPNNLLYWSIIKWGGENDFETFDLGGYQLNTRKDDKLYHINKFKLRWGGKIKKYPVYSYNPIYIIGRKIIRNFGFIKKLRDNIKVWKNRKKF
ncbi:MAG: peptidoglycan bridge formation glycyltransferase FemA/FemB family protein [Candidatus Pacearchaeota archaeon]|jgi:lipid II:glycine glycyltransferase (peptidoglycan interpeptide bridge formation enzyme)